MLVHGPIDGPFELADADGILVGASGDYLAAAAGDGVDVDGDGYDDFLVGSPCFDSDVCEGRAYLVSGPVTGESQLDDFVTIAGGGSHMWTGRSVSLGDIEPDGHGDLVIGAPRSSIGFGSVFIYRGPVLFQDTTVSTADIELTGEVVGDGAGGSVDAGGDGDGDGSADILIGAIGEDTYYEDAGATYLVHGATAATGRLSAADAKLVGRQTDEQSGTAVAWAGDLDGDGLDDILIGAPDNDTGGENAGAVYVVLSPVTGLYPLVDADARLLGECTDDLAGWAVDGAGDVNGDGLDDLLIGAPGDGSQSSGVAYLLFGPVFGTISLSDADVKLTGQVGEVYGDQVGTSVAAAGDVDSDGYADYLVGAPFADSAHGYDSGKAYLMLGGP